MLDKRRSWFFVEQKACFVEGLFLLAGRGKQRLNGCYKGSCAKGCEAVCDIRSGSEPTPVGTRSGLNGCYKGPV